MRPFQTYFQRTLAKYTGALVLCAPFWLACNDGEMTGQDTDDDLPPALIETCTEDKDCESYEICEQDVCIVGDRNNTLDESRRLRFDEPRSGVIEPAGDIDYFQFETLSPGQWVLLETVTQRETSEDIDTVVRLFQSNGLEHAAMDNYDLYRIVAADSSLVAYLPTAGTWYVSVEDVSTYYEQTSLRGGRDFNYELSLTRFDSVTAEAGSPLIVDLETGSQISRRGVLIETEGDVDELVLRAPYDGELLHVSGGRNIPGSSLITDVTFSLNGETVMRQTALGDESYGHVFRSQAEDYIVSVTDAQGRGGLNYWTVLYFRTFEPLSSFGVTFWGTDIYQEETEPNNDASTAEPMLRTDEVTASELVWLGGFVEGRINEAGDEDWYAFEIASGQNTTVRCYADRFGSLVDIAFELLDQDLNVVEAATEYAPWTAPHIYNVEDSSSRYLRVYAEDDSWGPSSFYRCQLVESDWTVAP
jgi:hypothetical protein